MAFPAGFAFASRKLVMTHASECVMTSALYHRNNSNVCFYAAVCKTLLIDSISSAVAALCRATAGGGKGVNNCTVDMVNKVFQLYTKTHFSYIGWKIVQTVLTVRTSLYYDAKGAGMSFAVDDEAFTFSE
jgi:hypothetical protein